MPKKGSGVVEQLERAGAAQTRADQATATAQRAWGRVRGAELAREYRARGGRITNISASQDRRETQAFRDVQNAER